MKLTAPQLRDIRTAFLQDGGDPLIGYMAGLNLHGHTGTRDDDLRRQAAGYGWADARTGALTPLGYCVADSCREYSFLQQRPTDAPLIAGAPFVTPDYVRGRSVAEIGCGMGAQLMPFTASAERVAGVEPMEIYAQLGAVLRERDGTAPIDIRTGTAERTPFEDGAFDLVFAVRAHVYFDFDAAAAELFRILRPGGELILVDSTLGQFLGHALRTMRWPPRTLRRAAVTLVNSLGYMATGRRILPARGVLTTSRPVYLTLPDMKRRLTRAGFGFERPPAASPPMTCLTARKPARQAHRR